MRISAVSLALCGVVLVAGSLSGELFGHGGQQPPPPPGPGNTGPDAGIGGGGGGIGGPGDTVGPPPPNTPPPKVLPPTGPGLGGGAPPPAGGSAGGATTGGGGAQAKKSRGGGWDRWEIWWEYNQDPFLNLRYRGGPVQTGAMGFLTGAGVNLPATRLEPPAPEEIERTILPVLKEALQEDAAEVLDSAAIAIGRVARSGAGVAVLEDLRKALGSRHPTVRQAALLGLGISGDRAAVPVLFEVMNDTRSGRALLGQRGAVSGLERAFAALALGFVCDRHMVPQILRVLERTADQDVEVVAGAILTLGLVDDAAADVVPFLARLLADQALDRRVRAQIPITLGRLGASAEPMAPVLMALARNPREDDAVRQSAVIALGRLGQAGDPEVQGVLRALLRSEKAGLLRHFAIIALGEMGQVALSDARRDMAGAAWARRQLLALLADPESASDVSWTALALGILGRAHVAGAEEREEIAGELLALFKRTQNPSDSGALAIALGLLEHRPAGGPLRERFVATHDAALAGQLATGLGLVGEQEAAADLRRRLLEDEEPRLRVDLATALALLGDRAAGADLLGLLEDAPTFAVTGSVARALGRVGDRQVVEPLLALVTDPSRSEAVRGFSCVALGLIAEKSRLPWNAPLSVGANYASGLAAQAELLDIF